MQVFLNYLFRNHIMIRRSITTTKIQKNYFSPPAKFFNLESKQALIFWECCSSYKRAATAVTYCSFDLFIFRPANMLLYSCGVSSPAATSCDMRNSTEPVFSHIILPSSLNPADFFSSSADFFFSNIGQLDLLCATGQIISTKLTLPRLLWL